MAALRAALALGWREATAVVGDDEPRRRRLGSRDLYPHRARVAVGLRVADRLTRHTVDEHVVRRRRGARRLVDLQLGLDARAPPAG